MATYGDKNQVRITVSSELISSELISGVKASFRGLAAAFLHMKLLFD